MFYFLLALTRVRWQFLSNRQVVLANLHKFKLQSREQLPLTTLSSRDQFRHVLSRFITASMSGALAQRQPSQVVIPTSLNGGLKKMPPYWYPYTTMAKERWLGREILEIVSTEFRDRSMEYYVGAPSLSSHPCDLDGYTLLRRGTLFNQVSPRSTERLQIRKQWSETGTVSSEWFPAIFNVRYRSRGSASRNVVHRHEPPVTATPVKIVLHDHERGFLVIDKPGSIVRHAPLPLPTRLSNRIIACTCIGEILPTQSCRDSPTRIRL